jgi:preprotein translocase subunit SecG
MRAFYLYIVALFYLVTLVLAGKSGSSGGSSDSGSSDSSSSNSGSSSSGHSSSPGGVGGNSNNTSSDGVIAYPIRPIVVTGAIASTFYMIL